MSKKYHFKHQYAFNQFQQVVTIDEAFKNNKGELYFKDIDCNIQFILVNGSIKEKHFRQPSEYTINTSFGNISNNQINESPEHYNFKMQIIKDGFFIIDDYKIYIKEPKDEYVLIGTKYRVDLYAKLLCDTPVIIEIIKSSDISKNKENYIKENEILTFKIYINDEGCQEPKQFDLYGNRKIEQLKNEIIRAERDYTNIKTTTSIERRNIEAKFKKENDIAQNKYREYIEQQDKRIDDFKQESRTDIREVENKIRDLRQKILYTLRKIKEFRNFGSRNICSIEQEIKRIEGYCEENKYY